LGLENVFYPLLYEILLQYRPVIRKPDIRKSGYKKGSGRVPAELLFVIT
jgi:hypothetical protein